MIKAAVIVDKCKLAKWQLAALEQASGYLDIRLFLSCENTETKRSYFKNFLYYVLNSLSLKNHWTRKSEIKRGESKLIRFNALSDGSWQRIPKEVADNIKNNEIEIVIKFGMGLLRIDDHLSGVDILSFHHGDPSEFRGRPAGFYEIFNNKNKIGTIVQVLSNKLDAGEVLVIAYSKIHHYSYHKTAKNFYSNSQYLLREAVKNYIDKRYVPISKDGKNHRLPSNAMVLRFLFKLMGRKLKRIGYGLFYEKKWNIVKLPVMALEGSSRLEVSLGEVPEVSPGYIFYADPFFSSTGDVIRAEAMNASSGLGEIVELGANDLSFVRVLLKGKHFSYPLSYQENSLEILLPEVSSDSSPYYLKPPFYKGEKIFIYGLENERVVDATIAKHENVYYLFFGMSESAADCLYLYYSDSLSGAFQSHPQSPVVIDPEKARMAGRILEKDGNLYRMGQNNCFGYGDGITVNKIVHLSKKHYEESTVGSISFKDAFGPHTLDIFQEQSVLDFYTDKFSMLAGYRRLLPKIIGQKKKMI